MLTLFLQGKVVLLTGASSGIGKAIAYEVAKKGGNLILVSRSLDKLNALAEELINLYQTEVLTLSKDLTIKEDIETTVSESMNHFNRIDYLINSSGMGTFKAATQFDYDDIDYMFKLNSLAMMYLSELVAREMIIQSIPGSIMFISSVAGKIATVNSSVYSATKFSIIGYANSLRLELKRYGIKVTTINPGPVQTEFFSHDQDSRDYYQRVKMFSLKPEKLAQDIVKSMHPKKKTREIVRPRLFNVVDKFYQLFPKTGDYLASDLLNFKEKK